MSESIQNINTTPNPFDNFKSSVSQGEIRVMHKLGYTATEIRVYEIIRTLTCNQLHTIASNAMISEYAGVSERRVRSAIASLEKKGLVSRVNPQSGRSMQSTVLFEANQLGRQRPAREDGSVLPVGRQCPSTRTPASGLMPLARTPASAMIEEEYLERGKEREESERGWLKEEGVGEEKRPAPASPHTHEPQPEPKPKPESRMDSGMKARLEAGMAELRAKASPATTSPEDDPILKMVRHHLSPGLTPDSRQATLCPEEHDGEPQNHFEATRSRDRRPQELGGSVGPLACLLA